MRANVPSSSCTACGAKKGARGPAGPPGPGTVLLWGNATLRPEAAPPATEFLSPGFSGTVSTTTPIQIILPVGGVLRNLNVRQNQPGAGVATLSYITRVNNAATILFADLDIAAASGQNLAVDVPVDAGDVVDIQILHPDLSAFVIPQDVTVTIQLAAI